MLRQSDKQELKIASGDLGIWLHATGTVTNTGTDTINLGTLGIVLFDANGKPLGYMRDSSAVMGLLPNQKKGFSFDEYIPGSMASKIKATKVFAYALDF